MDPGPVGAPFNHLCGALLERGREPQVELLVLIVGRRLKGCGGRCVPKDSELETFRDRAWIDRKSSNKSWSVRFRDADEEQGYIEAA
jgi:hypothetical protein